MKILLRVALWGNVKAKGLAIRLVKWTGKSSESVHPKHLLDDSHYWYMEHIRPGARLLDVGCGNGQHSLRVASLCQAVTGFDMDEASVQTARRERTARRVMAVFYIGDATKSWQRQDWGGLYFDVILCHDLLEHVHGRQKVLGMCRRALKPGGRLLLSVPNSGTSWKRRLRAAGLPSFSDPDHKIEYTLPELRGELEAAGFEIESLHPSVYDTPLVGLIDIIGGLSVTLYRKLTALRVRLAKLYPTEGAGWYCVCRVKGAV